MVRKGEISAKEWLIKNGAGQETDNISVEKTKEIAEEKEAGTSEAEKKKNIIKKNQARLKRREALGKTKRGKNSDIVFKDGGFQINQGEEKKEQSAIPNETSKEVKTEEETQTRTGEPSTIEKPEEKTTGDLERKNERIKELEKREKELLEIFEQNKNKLWVEKKDVITATINELEKVRAEKAETEKEIADSRTSVQVEDIESDYDIAGKRKSTKEELEKLNPLITKATNAADVYIPEKFIEEEPGQQKTIEPLIANEETMQKEYEIAFEKTRIKNLESKLAAMEAEIKRQEIQIEQSKNPTFIESIKKYWKDPKVKGIVIGGLIGAGIYTASGGTAPIYFALKTALGYKSLFIPAYLGHGFSTWGTIAAIGGLIGHFTEKLGLMKGEKSDREKRREGLENIKNAGSEQRLVNISGNAELKIGEPQITREKTEKEESNIISSEDAVKYFEENKVKSNDELNLEDIKKMMEAIKPETTKNLIKFLVNKEKRKNNDIFDWLWKKKKEIEKTQKERFDKKAEEAKDFIGQLKEGKKTGKEIYEYLVEMRYRFLHFDEINFNSKIKPEIDKLSKKEKTDMIDLAVEYLKMWEAEKKSVNKGGFEKTLIFVVYDKIGFTQKVYEKSGKPENVKWLYGNKS